MRGLPSWITPAATAAAIVLLVAVSAWHRWVFLAESPYPLGIDGYFYAVELRGLLEDGALVYPASPLGFWLLAPFAAVTDPITGAKLGAAVLGALIAVPAYFVGRRLGGSRAAGLLAAGLATSSAGSFYLSIEFVKNGVGLTVATTYVWMLLRALEAPRAPRIALAAVAFAAAVATHKMAAALALAVTVPAIVVEVRARVGAWRRVLVAGALAAGALGVVVVVLAIAFPGRVLGGAELALAGEVVTSRARWQLPALDGARPIWMGHEAAIGGGLAVVLLALLALPRRDDDPVRPAARAVGVALAVVALAIALPWLDVADPQGLGFRLRIAAFLPMALVAATVVGLVAPRLPRDVREAGLVAFAVAWVALQPARRDEGVVRTHPAMATAVAALAGQVPDGAVVVCPERHILFMAAWYARAEVRLRPEGVAPERRWRLIPLAFTGRGSPLDQALVRARGVPGVVPPLGLHPRHPNGLVLLPEATWNWVLGTLPDDVARRYNRWRTI